MPTRSAGQLPALLHPLAYVRRLRRRHRLSDWLRAARFRLALRRLDGGMRVRVHEDEREYTIVAALPGVDKDDVRVRLGPDTVDISASTALTAPAGASAAPLRGEQYVGQQRRRLQLAREIDEAGASAEYRDGRLTLHLPKRRSGTVVPVR